LNLDLWNSFSEWEKAIFRNAANAENNVMKAEYDANNARALTALINDHGVKLKTFSDEILLAMKQVALEVLEEIAAEDDFTGRVYESYKVSLARTSYWSEISEHSYARARGLGDV